MKHILLLLTRITLVLKLSLTKKGVQKIIWDTFLCNKSIELAHTHPILSIEERPPFFFPYRSVCIVQ